MDKRYALLAILCLLLSILALIGLPRVDRGVPANNLLLCSLLFGFGPAVFVFVTLAVRPLQRRSTLRIVVASAAYVFGVLCLLLLMVNSGRLHP